MTFESCEAAPGIGVVVGVPEETSRGIPWRAPSWDEETLKTKTLVNELEKFIMYMYIMYVFTAVGVPQN